MTPPALAAVSGRSNAGQVLAGVFFWMLFANFALQLMEWLPTVVPLQLKALGAGDVLIGFVKDSLAAIVTVLFNPWLASRSDRHRGRLGRRRPFLLASAGPIAVIFVALGWLGYDGRGLPAWAAIGLISLLCAGFFFLSLTALQVFQYMIPDVIPQRSIALFSGLYFAVGGVAGYVFNRVFFPQVETNPLGVYASIALFYMAAVLLLAWRVREPAHDPPPPREPGAGWAADARAYLRTCTAQRAYLLIFAVSTLFWSAYIPFNTYFVFFATEAGTGARSVLDLPLADYAQIRADTFIPKTIAALALGALITPRTARAALTATLALMVATFLAGRWLVTDGESLRAWWIGAEVLAAAFTVSCTSLMAYVFPRERYGVLFSANQTVFCLGMMLSPLACGALLDSTGDYRLLFFWAAGLFALAGGFALALMRAAPAKAS